MKNAIILAALAVSLLAGTDASAQGKGKGKDQKKSYSGAQQQSSGGYHHHNNYGKNHGSYQGRGRKVGHYRKDGRTDQNGVYHDRSDHPRRVNTQPVPQPLPQPTRDRSVGEILGTR